MISETFYGRSRKSMLVENNQLRKAFCGIFASSLC